MKIVTSRAVKLFLFIFLLSSGFFVGGAKVEAASTTWYYYYTYPAGQSCTGGDSMQCSDYPAGSVLKGTFSASTDKDSYAPGETIVVTLHAHDNASGNCSDFGLFGCAGGHGMRITASVGGSVGTNNQTADWTVSRNLTAPATLGYNIINLDGGWYDTDNFRAWSSMGITVVAPSCGAYSGTDSLTPTCVYNLNAPITASGSSYTTTSVASPAGYTGSRTWNCSNGTWSAGSSYTCTAPGVCGTANGKTYPSGTTGYSPDTQCSVGISTNTQFPPPGGTYAWLCNNNGSYSPMCQAWRATTVYSCTGTIPANASMFPNDNIGLTTDTPYSYWPTDTGTRCQYSCNGGYTWDSASNSCVATLYSCTNLPSTNVSTYPTPDNTGLSSDTAYTYSATDTATKCQYACDTYSNRSGSSCVTNACQGSVPGNATMFADDNTNLTNNITNYSYWATDTGTRCQYSCNSAYTWNGSSCDPPLYFCTGTIPANASMFAGDNVGLAVSTPYTYWATDTGTRCQYSCNGGYTWNGSSCVAVTGAPTCSSTGPGTPTTTTSGTYSVYAYGVSSTVTAVSFPTWGDVGGKDDIVWYGGANQGGGTWRGDINMANHKAGNPEYGNINVHIYMDAPAYAGTWCGTANFTRTLPPPTVDLQINGQNGSTPASPINVSYPVGGGTVPFTWTTSNAVTCSGGGPNFGGANPAKSTSPGVQTEYVAIPASADTSPFTLTCYNAAGNTIDTEYMRVTCAETNRTTSACSKSCGTGTKHSIITTTCRITNGPDIDCNTAPCGGYNWKEVAP